MRNLSINEAMASLPERRNGGPGGSGTAVPAAPENQSGRAAARAGHQLSWPRPQPHPSPVEGHTGALDAAAPAPTFAGADITSMAPRRPHDGHTC